jgi:nitroreductase/FMN reductase [NAD(P)H]
MSQTMADLIRQRFGLDSEAGRSRPAEGEIARILGRRTHRRYRPDPVPDDLLQVLLAAALSASSKSDLQQASIVVVKSKAKQATIAGWIPAMPWVAQAPLFMVFCGDNRRQRRLAELRDKPFPNDNLDQFMNAAVDAALVMQTFILAAEVEGLGCCPISVVRNHIGRLTELLELPPSVFPVAGLCVGYPATAGKLSMRLPPAVTVHVDRYDDADFPAELAAYDRRRAAREPTPRESQRHADRYGHLEEYGWSEDKARQYSVPERADFGAFIRAHGFALT